MFCYFGLVKVAETLLNPLGNDDTDFEINYIIDRNLQVCITKLDFLQKSHPAKMDLENVLKKMRLVSNHSSN